MQTTRVEEAVPAVRVRSGASRFVAATLALALFAEPLAARAQDTQPDEQAAQQAAKERERATCRQRLGPLEQQIASDGRYAQGWRDTWYVVGVGSMALSTAAAFTVTGYRRTEAFVGFFQSALLMVQIPTAVNNLRALDGVRQAEALDPCLALVNARAIFESNEDDWEQHTKPWQHGLAILLPIVMSAVVAGATGHWDFAVGGNEGALALIGSAIGELQVLTYPRPSVRTSGTALSLSF